MASNYPTSLDTFTNPSANDSLNSPSHALQHANANDAIEALEAKVGIGSSTAGSATAGHVLVASTGGTTSWTTVTAGAIATTGGTAGQYLTAGTAGVASWADVTAPGMTLINTTSFSGASSVSLATNTFSSTYTNYRLVCSFASSAGNETRLRFRASGSDDSSNSYYTANVGINSANSSANWYVSPGTYGGLASAVNNTTKTAFDITIYDPLATGDKIVTGTTVDSRAMNGRNIGIAFWSTTAFDSLTFYPSSGTITGTYSIYGLKK